MSAQGNSLPCEDIASHGTEVSRRSFSTLQVQKAHVVPGPVGGREMSGVLPLALRSLNLRSVAEPFCASRVSQPSVARILASATPGRPI